MTAHGVVKQKLPMPLMLNLTQALPLMLVIICMSHGKANMLLLLRNIKLATDIMMVTGMLLLSG
jgi:hypothetical protein